eukprot:CAMPEP_0202979214 /NCGR_PEP_ID=MMETSP1396-20130829/85432_1 /ASSEMBLY_ACC=CAM_ASM_000872 /TAXON_ID= /ORGANISM="Pseudokeronopsis sp., Strain Brazil" /LENGTH=69 /DNA_ID=CAMNT_0049718551 /DNA_START=1686 /DNA_END=1895 /DNA_ORIENTATION=-
MASFLQAEPVVRDSVHGVRLQRQLEGGQTEGQRRRPAKTRLRWGSGECGTVGGGGGEEPEEVAREEGDY